MISRKISQNILSIGPAYLPPKGGIAQIVYNYSREVFPSGSFRYISNSCEGDKFKKIFKLLSSLISFFFKLLFCREIKIVHIHTASQFSFKRSSWFVSIARLFNRKIVMHIHGGGFKTYFNDGYEAFVKKTLNKCDKIVVLSEEWKKWFCDELQYDNVAVIPNVIPIPQSCERREGDEKFHLLFLGLINKEKGIFDLIEAIAESKDQLHGKFLLHIAGNGMVSRLKNEINNKELQDVVKYEGWVDRDAKHELLCGCDTLVLPSYIEGLPMSILEAMSYHKPILSTPVGGIPSVLEDGVNGFLLEPGDGMGFIEKVIYLMEHEDAAKLMGESSFKKISEHFPESVAEKLVKLYKELIN